MDAVTPKEVIPCKICQEPFRRYSTLQNKCPNCEVKIKREKDVEIAKRSSNRPVGRAILGRGIGKGQVAPIKSPSEKQETFDNIKGKYGLDGISKVNRSPIKKRSYKKAEEDRILAGIKSDKIKEHGRVCESCGYQGYVDLSHLIGRRKKKFVVDRRNLILQCALYTFGKGCHDFFEHCDYEKIRQFDNFHEIMLRIREMDEGHYWTLVHKFKNQLKAITDCH